MRRTLKATAFTAMCAFVLALGSCTVSGQLALRESASAETSLDVQLSEEFATYLLDLSGVLGMADGPVSPFDLQALATAVDAEPGVRLVAADIPDPSRLSIRLDIEDLERAFTEGPTRIEGLVRLEDTGPDRIMTVTLSRERIMELTSVTPVSEQSSIEFLLPPEGMETGEYVEYLAWAMEEYETDTPIETIIRDARLTVRVTAPGEIVSVSGGVLDDGADGQSAEFSERVVTLLTTDQPTSWSVRYRR